MNRQLVRRVMPLLLIVAVALLLFVFDFGRYVSFDALKTNREILTAFVGSHAVLAPLAYILLYIVIVAFSLPGGAVMTISGGFLFGAIAGAAFALVGATTGATILFLIAKTSLGDYLLARAGPGMNRLRDGFAKNELSYMFVLRLVPLFPFFLVNLAPAFLGVSLRNYLVATLFGMMPGAFVYALAGSGLGSIFERNESFSVNAVLTPELTAALIGLGLLALIPVIYKRLAKNFAGGGEA